MGKLLGEREDVPEGKKGMVSTRDNSDYKWRTDQLPKGAQVLGALEFESEPTLNLHGEITQHIMVDSNSNNSSDYESGGRMTTAESLFQSALKVWHERHYRKAFLHACEHDVVRPTFCCGLLPDDGQYLLELEHLNHNKGGWVHRINHELMQEPESLLLLGNHKDGNDDDDKTKQPEMQLQLNVYLWTLHKLTGSSQTQILMMRFLAVPRPQGHHHHHHHAEHHDKAEPTAEQPSSPLEKS